MTPQQRGDGREEWIVGQDSDLPPGHQVMALLSYEQHDAHVWEDTIIGEVCSSALFVPGYTGTIRDTDNEQKEDNMHRERKNKNDQYW